MKTIVLVCALLTVQFSLAIRTKIRTSKERDVNNGDSVGASEVGPGAPNPANAPKPIIDGKRKALEVPPAVVVKVVEAKSKPSNAVVTKAFCIEVLQNVIKRQPPYFVDGKFTGDCRKDLVDQCGERMCQWALVYKAAASDCPGCPTSCGASAPSFFSSFPTALPAVLGNQKFLNAIKQEMASKAQPRFSAAPGDATPAAPPAAAAAPPPAAAAPAVAAAPPAAPPAVAAAPPAVAPPAAPPAAPAAPSAQGPPAGCNGEGMGCKGGTVTKGFCQQMLRDVIDGKAPYFIEGKFTGESRSQLISQCSLHICSWALKVHVAVTPQCSNSDCCLPETCKVPQEYIKDVVAKGQLLDIIKLIGKDDILKSLDPNNPPASIPAQKDKPSANLRGPITLVKKVIPPASNDPRDPEFKKPADSDAGAKAADEPAKDAPAKDEPREAPKA